MRRLQRRLTDRCSARCAGRLLSALPQGEAIHSCPGKRARAQTVPSEQGMGSMQGHPAHTHTHTRAPPSLCGRLRLPCAGVSRARVAPCGGCKRQPRGFAGPTPSKFPAASSRRKEPEKGSWHLPEAPATWGRPGGSRGGQGGGAGGGAPSKRFFSGPGEGHRRAGVCRGARARPRTSTRGSGW